MTLPDGSTIALADWVDDQFYGSLQFQDGDTTGVEAFSGSRSQQIPGGTRPQTRSDTNIPRPGQSGMPKGYEELVYSFGIQWVRAERPPTGQPEPVLSDGQNGSLSDPVTYRTAFNMDRVMFFEFVYNDKQYTQGVPSDYPQGHGLNPVSTNSAFETITNGVPSPRDRRAMVLPVHLREELGFAGSFSPQAPLVINQAASDGDPQNPLHFVDMKLYLVGLIKRPVV